MPEYVLDHGTPEASVWYAKLAPFTRAYIEAAFFADDPSHDNDSDMVECSLADLSPSAARYLVTTADAFLAANEDRILPYDDEAAGHDLWFTQQGHGVGFWARSDSEAVERYGSTENRDALDAAAHELAEVELYLGDDGLIYVFGHEND